MEMKQYTQLIQENPSWLPGKEAIINGIKNKSSVLPHFIELQEMTTRNNTLNGIFVSNDGGECIRLTTCGLSQIAPNEYAFGRSSSGWGAELTAALHSSDREEIRLCAKLLIQLAKYVDVRKNMFMEYSCVNLSRIKCREPLTHADIVGIVFIRDVKLERIETVHGSVDFLQIVGINSSRWKELKRTPSLVRQYIYEIKKYNPNLFIDQMENSIELE